MKLKWLALFLTFTALTALVACNSQAGKSAANGNKSTDSTAVSATKGSVPVMTFEEDTHDFGKLTEGEKVTYAFKFKNTGKSVLLISNVSTSCGCTVTSYPKQPVQPGQAATIDVSFNSEGKQGFQSKSISVYTNAEPPTSLLHITAQVVDPE